jgi:serine/threonine-protein kinase PknK
VRIELPNRYQGLTRLGRGGGGEVWEVRDRHTQGIYALKVLAEGAAERERAALVREAVALSALEGLGLPRIIHFGQLAGSGRLYMVRDLVRGVSLERLIEQGQRRDALEALVRAADQLTVIHRSGLLHGDFKPANVIVGPDGHVTLVDLGLSAPWREGGAPVEGLTPRYAAPELFRGAPLTVRAEVYALGVALGDLITMGSAPGNSRESRALREIVRQATHADPEQRPPSADELASAVRAAAELGAQERPLDEALDWPVVGIEETASRLVDAVRRLEPDGELDVVGPRGAGRSLLLRRLRWTLGIEGHPVCWIDAELAGNAEDVLDGELESPEPLSRAGLLLVDDADCLAAAAESRIALARRSGLCVVAVRSEARPPAAVFHVPPLDRSVAADLLRRAVPSLPERVIEQVLTRSRCRPGELRRLVRSIASEAVVGVMDIERLQGGAKERRPSVEEDSDRLREAVVLLDRGRYRQAQDVLAAVDETATSPVPLAVARARLELGFGEASAALKWLEAARNALERALPEERADYALYFGRAQLVAGDCAAAVETLASVSGDEARMAEARAYQGVALSYLGRQDEARVHLDEALAHARRSGSARAEGIALNSLGLVLHRRDDLEGARTAYLSASEAAERAEDAGTLATVQLALGGILQIGGEVAEAITRFEAAADMGRRSGRQSIVTHALLNLANLDLHLGRLSHAKGSLTTLESQREQLAPAQRAHLDGLQAELAEGLGQLDESVRRFNAAASAFAALDRGVDAAEARLEGILVAARTSGVDVGELRRELGQAEAELGGSPAHRALTLMASARVELVAGDERRARELIDSALTAARQAGQKEWLWRALEARAELEESGGQPLMARRDREEALTVLEEMAARLPRDLREVYWNDARRRQLRLRVQAAAGASVSMGVTGTDSSAALASATSTSLEQRLAQILGVNSELVGEFDVERLAARITEYAVRLLRAERGFILLVNEDGSLGVHALRSRTGDEQHVEFSRSIAETVINSGQPLVSLSARDDMRMASYASVHQLMLQSVACVPIRARARQAIGALYLETRLNRGAHFEQELPALQAFADQMAIALENARLINENKRRADELAETNRQLEAAQQRLRELLGDRTAKLKLARERLRETRDVLYGHFGYQGMVGTSAAMRSVYSLIERLKDTDVPVLLTGESGTGKEVAARALHVSSAHRRGRFIAINCGAIPEHLLESELFGSVRGAFTGADRDRRGLLREGEGGSVLLDEIGEMPHKMQAGLLRVLQEGKVRPVGGSQEEPVNIRLMFATNRDLDQLVRGGAFREDLYYRIHVVELRLPALRDRREDIPQLVDHFLGLFAARYKRERKTLTREALRRLCDYSWPGNVRQLEHVLLNAWVLSERPEIECADLEFPDGFLPSEPRSEREPSVAPEQEPRASVPPSIRKSRRSSVPQRLEERDSILSALEQCNWNRLRAAELLGIPRRTLYRRLKQYKIQ